jgi:hypothetical protein
MLLNIILGNIAAMQLMAYEKIFQRPSNQFPLLPLLVIISIAAK